MQITLLRHGQPDFDWKQNVKGTEIKNLLKAYDAANIIDLPTKEAKELAHHNPYVVCSHLLRSIQSAKAIGVAKIHFSDPMFREINLSYFENSSIKLPIRLWAIILRSLWFLGLLKNTESISVAKRRAKLAAQKLTELAHQHDSILFVGHGMINHYIAKELLKNHWSGMPTPKQKYWGISVYKK